MLDLVLRGGEVVDGTGAPPRRADIGVAGERIAVLGELADADARETLDVAGLTVTPGFVDLHAHSDLTLLADGRGASKIRQGVTTEVIGNCGLSALPAPPDRADAVRRAIAIVDLDPAAQVGWSTLADYASALGAAGIVPDVVPLVGHVSLRVAVAGDRAGPADAAMTAAMGDALDALLAQGAAGCSTGLMYPPASGADRAELVALAEVVARHDRLLAIHLRDYAGGLLAAVDEALDLARATGVRLQVSHLAVAGRANWGSVARAVERLEVARAAGLDVGCDIYPYLAGSANLSQLLPTWAQQGGPAAVAARAADPAARRRIVDAWAATLHLGWDEIELSLLAPGMEAWLGRTVTAIAEEVSRPPAELALDVIAATEDRAMMVAYGRSPADLDAVLASPLAAIGSDGYALHPDGPASAGRPHPRSFGCYPRLLGRTVRDEGRLPFERAVAMATSAPAARVGLTDRGRIAEGLLADLVVLDRARVRDEATFTDPVRFPVGIPHVVRRGRLVVRDDAQRDDVRPGSLVAA